MRNIRAPRDDFVLGELCRFNGATPALDPHPRADEGTRRTAGELVAFIEHLALTRPTPALATLHRLVSTEAKRPGLAVPSYSTVRDIVQSLDPALVTLALDGPAAYRDSNASPAATFVSSNDFFLRSAEC